MAGCGWYGTSDGPQDLPGAVDYTETQVNGDEKRGSRTK